MSFKFKVKDVEDKQYINKIEVEQTTDFGANYLFSVNDDTRYDGHSSIYLSLKQLERLSKKLAKFVEKELAKKEREKT